MIIIKAPNGWYSKEGDLLLEKHYTENKKSSNKKPTKNQ
jgi:hypothetical protein